MAENGTLPVPAQLEAQLGKCKTVRASDYYKSRSKTPAVSYGRKAVFQRYTVLQGLHRFEAALKEARIILI